MTSSDCTAAITAENGSPIASRIHMKSKAGPSSESFIQRIMGVGMSTTTHNHINNRNREDRKASKQRPHEAYEAPDLIPDDIFYINFDCTTPTPSPTSTSTRNANLSIKSKSS